jgi:hypothetical protein
MIRWRIVNTAPAQSGGLTASQPKAIHYDFSWSEIYYIDPAENKIYGYLTDSEGNRIMDAYLGTFLPGSNAEVGRSFRRHRLPRIKSA